ncbi:MAG: zinc ribbon domain-containing protein [Rhodoferax sp.]|jgi:putative FmdB family regulatory protein|nr:zinc ribbon domain-containing protein [Rhodoferax sp.]
MPIYAYKCDSCGFAKDVLQKISDQPLVQCPSCQAQTFKKQVTAAGFQLKGSGWYATDFKGGNTAVPAVSDSKSGDAKSGASASTESGGSAKTSSDTASTSTPAAKKTESTPSAGSGS